jgi:hypothetical protein
MCNCNKSEICSLKLKFVNYVNNNMIKETNMALELLRNINCDNLEEVKKELNNIVENSFVESQNISEKPNICKTKYNICAGRCNNIFDLKCFDKCDNERKKCNQQ